MAGRSSALTFTVTALSSGITSRTSPRVSRSARMASLTGWLRSTLTPIIPPRAQTTASATNRSEIRNGDMGTLRSSCWKDARWVAVIDECCRGEAARRFPRARLPRSSGAPAFALPAVPGERVGRSREDTVDEGARDVAGHRVERQHGTEPEVELGGVTEAVDQEHGPMAGQGAVIGHLAAERTERP